MRVQRLSQKSSRAIHPEEADGECSGVGRGQSHQGPAGQGKCLHEEFGGGVPWWDGQEPKEGLERRQSL